jgi:hypothetical protein
VGRRSWSGFSRFKDGPTVLSWPFDDHRKFGSSSFSKGAPRHVLSCCGFFGDSLRRHGGHRRRSCRGCLRLARFRAHQGGPLSRTQALAALRPGWCFLSICHGRREACDKGLTWEVEPLIYRNDSFPPSNTSPSTPAITRESSSTLSSPASLLSSSGAPMCRPPPTSHWSKTGSTL